MRNILLWTATAMLLAGCSEEAPPQEEKVERAALTPGLYELSWSDVRVGSTDGSEPATSAGGGAGENGAGFAAQTCVGDDGQIDPSAFAETGDECTPTNSYVRNGRIASQLECRRPDQPGQVLQSVNGTTSAQGLEAEVSTTTYFSGEGDYEMTRTVTGRRVGECPPAAEGEAEAEAAQ